MEAHVTAWREKPIDHLSWQGMGSVAEAMKAKGWNFHLSSDKGEWYAEFSDIPGRGVLADSGSAAPRCVAIAALSALPKDGD
jgi:hypothetical protein